MTENKPNLNGSTEEFEKVFAALKPFTDAFTSNQDILKAPQDILSTIAKHNFSPIMEDILRHTNVNCGDFKPCDDSCSCTNSCIKDEKTGCFDFDLFGGKIPASNLFGTHNIFETDDQYLVTIAVPGVTKDENLTAHMTENVLYVTYTSQESEEKDVTEKLIASNYTKEDFALEILLEKSDTKSIRALLANGELVLTIKKHKDVVTNITIK